MSRAGMITTVARLEAEGAIQLRVGGGLLWIPSLTLLLSWPIASGPRHCDGRLTSRQAHLAHGRRAAATASHAAATTSTSSGPTPRPAQPHRGGRGGRPTERDGGRGGGGVGVAKRGRAWGAWRGAPSPRRGAAGCRPAPGPTTVKIRATNQRRQRSAAQGGGDLSEGVDEDLRDDARDVVRHRLVGRRVDVALACPPPPPPRHAPAAAGLYGSHTTGLEPASPESRRRPPPPPRETGPGPTPRLLLPRTRRPRQHGLQEISF